MRTTILIGKSTNLVPITSGEERILRSADPSFRTALSNTDIRHDANDSIETL